MGELGDLFQRHGSDKHNHGYDAWYEIHLSQMRMRAISLLEIGVKSGASLRAWERYFPKATIIGVDNDPVCAAHSSGRTKIHIGNQADEDFMRRVAEESGPFDVVVDDGGHTMAQQKTSFLALWGAMRPGGIYVVEDLHTSYWESHQDGGPMGNATMLSVLKDLVDEMNTGHKRKGLEPRPIAVHFHRDICFVVRAP